MKFLNTALKQRYKINIYEIARFLAKHFSSFLILLFDKYSSRQLRNLCKEIFNCEALNSRLYT